MSRSNRCRQPNAIRAGGSERDRTSKAQAERRNREVLKTAISGTIQRTRPERHTHQTAKPITQARRHSTQTLQRPWGAAAITRWRLVFGVNHFVTWCLKLWSSGPIEHFNGVGFYECAFRCPTQTWQVFQDFGVWRRRLDPDRAIRGKNSADRSLTSPLFGANRMSSSSRLPNAILGGSPVLATQGESAL